MERLETNSMSKRERQIMDIFYQLEEATAYEVIERMPDNVGAESIRKIIRIMEKKEFLKHVKIGHKYLYSPVIPVENVGEAALHQTVKTFFQDSALKAAATLLDMSKGSGLNANDIEEIQLMIKKLDEKEGK